MTFSDIFPIVCLLVILGEGVKGMGDCGCEGVICSSGVGEKKTLWVLLVINAAMFVGEAIAGWLAESTGLLADSLDMFADAAVYATALYAVGKSDVFKLTAARISGVIQMVLGFGVLAEVSRRFIFGSQPVSLVMIGVGFLALAANLACVSLIAKYRNGEIHMRASWIFSVNDALANLGVIVSGVLVRLLHNPIPDLLIGTIISAIVIKGGIKILKEAQEYSSEYN